MKTHPRRREIEKRTTRTATTLVAIDLLLSSFTSGISRIRQHPRIYSTFSLVTMVEIMYWSVISPQSVIQESHEDLVSLLCLKLLPAKFFDLVESAKLMAVF